MPLSRLDHVTILCSDLERSRAFYAEALGLVDGDRPPFDFPGAWLWLEGRAVVISSQNFLRSILPPETMATIGPLPALPVSAAASGNAPAPSEMIRAFSAISRIAFRLFQADDDIAVHQGFHALPHAREHALAAGAVDEGGFPVRENLRRSLLNDSAAGAAVSGSAPNILTSGFSALTALATPTTSPPPPMPPMMAACRARLRESPDPSCRGRR
jgi:catechol 2,3-dioxygenase-like lactoylglutathione lyase family enzyme